MAKKLEDWQIEDARRLKALFEKRAEQSQLAFGHTHEIGNQSMVSQYLLGVRPLNIVAASKFARGLRVTIDEFSPTLAEQIQEAWHLTDAGSARHEGQPLSRRTAQTDNLADKLDDLLPDSARDDRAAGRQQRRRSK